MMYLCRCPEVDTVLVLDDGCAAEIASQLAQFLQELNPPRPIAIIFAVREYETWFLAAAHSLWGKSYEGDPGGGRWGGRASRHGCERWGRRRRWR